MVLLKFITGWRVFFVFTLVFILQCGSAKVQFFEEMDFKGYKHEETSSERCSNLPDDFRHSNGSIKTDGCIMVYQEENCYPFGFVIKREQPVLWAREHTFDGDNLLRYTVTSFRDCTDLVNSTEINVHIYGEKDRKGGIEGRFTDVCGCNPLPKFLAGKEISANTHGNCVRVYKQKNCEGKSWEKYGEHDTMDFRIYDDNGFHDILSFKPCTLTDRCRGARFSATLLKNEPTSDQHPASNTRHETIFVGKQNIDNNHSSVLVESYEITATITESATFQFSRSLNQIYNINIGNTNGIKLTGWIPIPKTIAILSMELASSLTVGFNRHQSHNESSTFTITSDRNTSFKINKAITVPPCTSTEVSSFVKIVRGIFNYRVEMQIRGVVDGDERMTAEEICKYLKKIKCLKKEDDFTVLGESYGKLLMKNRHGLNSDTSIAGTPLPECKKRFNL